MKKKMILWYVLFKGILWYALLVVLTIMLSSNGFSQAHVRPGGFNYQAVARDGDGSILRDMPLRVELSIYFENVDNQPLWQEVHEVETNDYGLFNLVIGDGISTNIGTAQTFESIDWKEGAMLLGVKMDGGAGLVDMGAVRFQNVPYSKVSDFAEHSGDSEWLEALILSNEEQIDALSEELDMDIADVVELIQQNADELLTHGLILDNVEAVLQNHNYQLNLHHQNIVENTQLIEGLMAELDSDSSYLMSLIVANKTDIEENESEISDNAEDIEDNKQAIVANQYAISVNRSSIEANDAAITVNSTGISANANGIATNVSDIADLNVELDSDSAFLHDLINDIDYAILIDSDSDTKIQVEESADEDVIRFDIEGSEKWIMTGSTLEPRSSGRSVMIGQNAGLNDDLSSNENVYIGYESGKNGTTSYHNVGVGAYTLKALTTGRQNVAIGYYSGQAITEGYHNIGVGFGANRDVTTGDYNIGIGAHTNWSTTTANSNIAIGHDALQRNATGSSNVSVGRGAAFHLTGGSGNTYLGSYAGSGGGTNYSNANNNTFIGMYAGNSVSDNSSGNIFLGYSAGSSETGSNKLYIENSSSSTPLIYGDFTNDILRTNGTLQVNDPASTGYSFPATDGTSGQFLTTDGSGNVAWALPETGEMADADADTKIQVEESADEDVIRFDIEGTERWSMVDRRLVPANSGNSVMIGQDAGLNDDNSNRRNILIGTSAGRSITSASNNIALGYDALRTSTTSSYNIAIGSYAAKTFTGTNSVFIGYQAGGNAVVGNNATAIGYYALNKINGGYYNTAIGYSAGFNTLGGDQNTYVGHEAGYTRTAGFGNVNLGYSSGYYQTSGNYNISIGHNADRNTGGSYNISIGNRTNYNDGSDMGTNGNSRNITIGTESGYKLTTNSNGNIFLGYQSGYEETGSNKLYIENSNSTTPLIYGDFNTDLVRINGTLETTGDLEVGSDDAFYFGDPSTDGTWRIVRSGNDLAFERRESGSWMPKVTMQP